MSVLDRPQSNHHGGTATGAQRVLLACGVAYGPIYIVTNDVVAANFYQGYSRMDQAISELSATSAPTRSFLVAMLPVGTALLIAFGIGVWITANANRALRVIGGLMIALGITGVAWLPFPMSSREDMTKVAMPANDLGHLVLSAVTVLLILAIIGFGAVAIRNLVFRLYSAVTVMAVGFGTVVGMQAPNIPEGLPTQWMGLFERVNVYGYMLWVAVFAVILLRSVSAARTEHSSGENPRGSSGSRLL